MRLGRTLWCQHASSGRAERGFTLIELLVVLVVLAIVLGVAIQSAFYAFDVSRTGKTFGNMRGLATLLLEYASTEGTLPGDGSLQTVAEIEANLKKLGAPVPKRDGWGNVLYYQRLEGANGVTFRIYSYGKDNTPDGDTVTGVWVDFYSDIVNEGGSFIQGKW